MNKYRLLSKKGEGTFSEVLKATCIATNQSVAIKCMKTTFKSLEQVNSLREIQALRRLTPYIHIISLLDVIYERATGKLALVFELMDKNLYELIRHRKQPMSADKVRHLMYQLLRALERMHRSGVFHRDIKPENVLVTTVTTKEEEEQLWFEVTADEPLLKIADYGSCRGIHSQPPYTEYISTRWYRAPECLLTNGFYDHRMDIWGVGCVMYELLTNNPLFAGSNEIDQLEKIYTVLGDLPAALVDKYKNISSTTSQCKNLQYTVPGKYGAGLGLKALYPTADSEALHLIQQMLHYEPEQRITAKQALKHPFFAPNREKEKQQLGMKNMNALKQTSKPASRQAAVATPLNNITNMADTATTLPRLQATNGTKAAGKASYNPPSHPSQQRTNKASYSTDKENATTDIENELQKLKTNMAYATSKQKPNPIIQQKLHHSSSQSNMQQQSNYKHTLNVKAGNGAATNGSKFNSTLNNKLNPTQHHLPSISKAAASLSNSHSTSSLAKAGDK